MLLHQLAEKLGSWVPGRGPSQQRRQPSRRRPGDLGFSSQMRWREVRRSARDAARNAARRA